MSLTETVIEGTLKPDGTLELDQKPNLPPGRITVVVRQEREVKLQQEGWWPLMQRIRAEREAAGYHFMPEAEMNSHLMWLRDDLERMDTLYRDLTKFGGLPMEILS